MKYLSHLDFKIRDSMRLYEQYEKELQKNFQILINDEAIWSDDSKGQADFNQKFQYLITPLLFSLSSIGKDVENKFNEFPLLQTEYKRKYKEAAFQGEISEPETAKLVSELIERNKSLEARGSENIKSEIIFLSLAHFFKAM